MTNLTSIPLVDAFETTLSQERDGGTGAVYLNTVPGFTFPSGYTTAITVNPWKDNQQVALINALDSSAKTVTVSSISVNKWASLSYTQQTHAVWSVVKISNPYHFRDHLDDIIRTKVNTNDEDVYIWYYASEAARDADLTSPTIGKDLAFSLAEWTLAIYTSSWWVEFDTGTVTQNASTTVAWKVEEATSAEHTAGTGTWWTWAPLFSSPDVIQASIQSWEALYAWASAVGTDAYAVTMTPTLTAYTEGMIVSFEADVANTGACSINIDSLGVKNIKTKDGNDPQDWVVRVGKNVIQYDGTNFVLLNEDFATTSNKWLVEKATAWETTSWTADKFPDASEIKTAYENLVNVVTWTRTSWEWAWSEDIAHWLARTPKFVLAFFDESSTTWIWFYADSAESSIQVQNSGHSREAKLISNSSWYEATVTGLDGTNLSVTWSSSWTNTTSYTLMFFW